jgi:hypothetical protein
MERISQTKKTLHCHNDKSNAILTVENVKMSRYLTNLQPEIPKNAKNINWHSIRIQCLRPCARLFPERDSGFTISNNLVQGIRL